VIAIGIFDIFGAGDLRRQTAAQRDRHLNIGSTMHHKCRNLDARQYRRDINLTIHSITVLRAPGLADSRSNLANWATVSGVGTWFPIAALTITPVPQFYSR